MDTSRTSNVCARTRVVAAAPRMRRTRAARSLGFATLAPSEVRTRDVWLSRLAAAAVLALHVGSCVERSRRPPDLVSEAWSEGLAATNRSPEHV
jgi:hypothetical protein